jgi:transcriptional regulator of met regulon
LPSVEKWVSDLNEVLAGDWPGSAPFDPKFLGTRREHTLERMVRLSNTHHINTSDLVCGMFVTCQPWVAEFDRADHDMDRVTEPAKILVRELPVLSDDQVIAYGERGKKMLAKFDESEQRKAEAARRAAERKIAPARQRFRAIMAVADSGKGRAAGCLR